MHEKQRPEHEVLRAKPDGTVEILVKSAKSFFKQLIPEARYAAT